MDQTIGNKGSNSLTDGRYKGYTTILSQMVDTIVYRHSLTDGRYKGYTTILSQMKKKTGRDKDTRRDNKTTEATAAATSIIKTEAMRIRMQNVNGGRLVLL
ncbi:hypothetical protein CHS0354_005700 [Potamilus streckersoni]|uniref:Uncharacterized protein n=1 Tax=Potamilus streckersoni TaxID=2493646 RepID=A0AAE0S3Q2_9BIVA|nr:hypothetical protein CHS0354_005700 [Potamilus streckersoni]